MILDKQYLKINQTQNFTEYTYNYPSKDKKIEIILTAKKDDFQIKYTVAKWLTDLDDKLIDVKDNVFETYDLKQAWEKFEDYFEETQKEENPQQEQEPEVQVLMISVEKSGKSYVYLQKQDGSQELLLELNINDSNIINNKPKFAELDFTNDSNLQEPFNTKWALAFVEDVKYEQASTDCTTYIVALKSIDQPGQNEPSKESDDKQGQDEDKQGQGEDSEPIDDDGELKDDKGDKERKNKNQKQKPKKGGDKTDEPGEPTDEPDDDEKHEKPSDEPGDDEKHEKPSDEPGDEKEDKKPEEGSGQATINKQIVSDGVSKIAKQTGLSVDDVQSSLRSERIFDSFLSINNVDVNKLKSALGVSDLTKNQFLREMVKNA